MARALGRAVSLAGLGVLAAWFAAGTTAAIQQPPQTRPPMVRENATIKVSDHVYAIMDDNVPLVPNVGIIVGSKGTLVVDTGLGPKNAEAILREVAKVSKNADLYLVTTHFHPEHAAGSSAFPAGAKFVVSRVQQNDIDELGLDLNARFAGFSPAVAKGETMEAGHYVLSA